MKKNASIINKMFVYLNYVVNGNSCMYFEIDRALDTALLQKALDILVRRHPLLNCRLAKTLFGYQWQAGVLPGNIDLQCQECDTLEKGKILDLLRQNAWQQNYRIFRERHLRAYYLQTPSSYYVQLVPNHILADARSSDLLMADLASIYNSLSRGLPIVLNQADAALSYSDNSAALFAGDLSFTKKMKLYFLASANIVIDMFRGENGIVVASSKNMGRKRGETRVVSKEIDADLVRIMKPRLKDKGFTIHPILVLSVLRAVKTYNERRGERTDLIRVSDMFSLLPFAKQDLTSVYDCFVVPFTSYYKMTGDDMEMMDAIRNEITGYKKGGILRELFRQAIYTTTGTFSPKKMATELVTRFIAKSNIIISNPGLVKFDVPDFGDAKIVSYTSFSQLFPPARIFFLFSTFRDKLRLNILYDENAFSGKEVEKEIYDGFLQNLRRISDRLGDSPDLLEDKPQPLEVAIS